MNYGCPWSLLFYACPYPSSKPSESQITIPVTLLRDLCIHPNPPFLHTLNYHLNDCECVVVQVSPALHFPHLLPPPVPQWEADICAVPCGGCPGGCQEDAEAVGLKPATRPSPAVPFTKARDLLPHSQTTFCHISPQTRFPCKPSILQPLLSSSIFMFPSQAHLT